jgi:plastocyanin
MGLFVNMNIITNRATALTNYLNGITPGLPAYSSFLMFVVLLLALSTASLCLPLLSFPASQSALAQNQSELLKQGQQQPNIQASYIYQTQTMVLGKNIKNLVILIPNEGHEYPHANPKELRIVNQPYVPQNAVANVGTTVAWLNADAGHHHSITLVNNNTKNIVFDSGRFDNFNASKPFTFNNVGAFAYSGPSYDKMWPKYKMNGTITVINQPLATTFNSTATSNAASTASSSTGSSTNSNNFDPIDTFMVPANIADKTISDLKSKGFTIDNQHPFMSLRGGGSPTGGDKQQVLLVLASPGKNLNEVTSALSQVDATLTYK